MRILTSWWQILTHMGPAWVFFRVRRIVEARMGVMQRRAPTSDWGSLPVTPVRLRQGATHTPRASAVENGCVDRAAAILRGEFRLFGYRVSAVGFPPDWHRNQLSGERPPTDRHWAELDDFEYGDIKGIWELSRFPWAFDLARAYRCTGEERWAEGFWCLFEDWCEKNPPNFGINWKCGQEATFRLMAATFAAETMAAAKATTQARLDGFSRFVTVTGQRISANVAYALSQKNNHGVSESVGLISAGLLVPHWPPASAWRRRGLCELRSQLDELVYADGGMAMHSLVYHRVVLHDLSWAILRMRISGSYAPKWLVDTLARSASFLAALTDADTGLAPLYGANDGSRVLPLSETDSLDMRPSLQTAAAALNRPLPFGPGAWDESAEWIDPREGRERASRITPRLEWHAPNAGCLLLVTDSDRLFMRCPTIFLHRPAHADMLHVDINLGGEMVAHDGGSYSYNDVDGFSTALTEAAQHNVLTIDGVEPMVKVSRFLSLPWPKGTIARQADGSYTATHDGYKRLGVQWRRTVSRIDHGWAIKDEVTNPERHPLRWNWRLSAGGWVMSSDQRTCEIERSGVKLEFDASAPMEVSLLHASAGRPEGWWAPHYSELQPACALVATCATQSQVVVTWRFRRDPPKSA